MFSVFYEPPLYVGASSIVLPLMLLISWSGITLLFIFIMYLGGLCFSVDILSCAAKYIFSVPLSLFRYMKFMLFMSLCVFISSIPSFFLILLVLVSLSSTICLFDIRSSLLSSFWCLFIIYLLRVFCRCFLCYMFGHPPSLGVVVLFKFFCCISLISFHSYSLPLFVL